MVKNLKALGLALMALAAIGALMASSAAAAEFHSESEKTTIVSKAEGHHVFDAASNSITCTEANFDATTTKKTTSEITFTGTYGGCTFFGVGVTVEMNNCDYIFHADGTVDIGGTGCTFITFRASIFGIPCDVKVTPQTGLKSVAYTNIGSGSTTEVTLSAAVNGIVYHQEGGGCGSHNEGRYTTGTSTATGLVDGTNTHTGIWWG
jgi:hypothetical protein